MSKRSNPVLTALLPVGIVIRSRFDSLSKIDHVKAPLMVIHGDRDDVIPIEVGRELWEAAREPKRFLTVPGAGHSDTYLVGADSYFNAPVGLHLGTEYGRRGGEVRIRGAHRRGTARRRRLWPDW